MLVPHWNWQLLIVAPFGFTVPFKVAAVCDTSDTASVTTVGAFGSVVNDISALPTPHGDASELYWTSR